MADVLSQSEIDALLSSLSTGEVDADELKKEEKDKRIKSYDFKRALRFSKDQVRSITRIHENFARLLTTQLSAHLRTYVSLQVASVDQLPYEEFIRSVPKMTILNVFEPYPLEGRLVMEVNPNIAYSMLDRMLGGQGEPYNKVENLTEIETKIMQQLFQRMLEVFREAWLSVEEFDPLMEDLEVNPQFLQLVSPNETVVVISFSTTIGESSGMINICLPHVVIESILPKLSVHLWMQEKQRERDDKELQSLEHHLQKAQVPLSVELGRSAITVEELLQLQRGDMIELDQLIDDSLTARVEEEAKFKVQPGKVKHHLAVQVTEVMEEDYHDER
ncbi:flagellar motor switch protein FliM [Alkalicoccus urumqiensis]|uniref:Flagellar motor switch protein FliM n=1 Tax=Alkalicoccus urumqiensis TaxID=1548213 RepID=A0A2P6MG29_ALKUR|nr:flagellar motor switch protein FliM [Alkalicoccus urumqiensis]PRO65221.1 flagellar motor switch protein FliM [Alkalicoccus urumqiensis]